MIKGYFVGEKVSSTSPDAFSLYEKSRFGEKKRGKVEYASVEALYLVDNGKMDVVSGRKELDFDALLEKFKRKDKKIEVKFVVFGDLRKKGYVVKTALKFGAEFRVYDKGVKPGEDHARWVLYTVRENEQMNWHDFSAKNRVAHSTKKNLLLGIVDEEGDVTYYEVGWRKV
ncbi:MAG: tRNA-intron lyase [Nanoarchaeota archaeon]|nr:tRNA-intron lyase [Nanoarchaeota archaeon]MBU1050935.1 tRNA-intron lyase [Nanoarchaeota archaeon]MBU1988468.1 tRNA-intron lyase [Nanoarchaeota archaeon]